MILINQLNSNINSTQGSSTFKKFRLAVCSASIVTLYCPALSLHKCCSLCLEHTLTVKPHSSDLNYTFPHL